MIQALAESKPAWVRVFLGWNGLEPAQGAYNTAEIASYAHFFSKLPAGTKIDVAFIGWIRPELKFNSLDALVDRMQEDAALARAALARVPDAFPALGVLPDQALGPSIGA